jgi:hypothetical protein
MLRKRSEQWEYINRVQGVREKITCYRSRGLWHAIKNCAALYLCVWLDNLATQVSAIPTSIAQAWAEARDATRSVWRSMTKLFLQHAINTQTTKVAGTEMLMMFPMAVQVQVEIQCC